MSGDTISCRVRCLGDKVLRSMLSWGQVTTGDISFVTYPRTISYLTAHPIAGQNHYTHSKKDVLILTILWVSELQHNDFMSTHTEFYFPHTEFTFFHTELLLCF